MPVYDYKCQTHGIFYELATMEHAHLPQACPQCATSSPRIICLSPDIMGMVAERRNAFETNERAQHEPVFSTADRRAHDKDHSRGCGCQKKMGKSKLLYTSRGEKMFPSMRPWMISH